jgi:hypothetical protein
MPDNNKLTGSDFFDAFDEDVLIEMAINYPRALHKMCALITLDLQLDKEGNDKSISNWGEVC